MFHVKKREKVNPFAKKIKSPRYLLFSDDFEMCTSTFNIDDFYELQNNSRYHNNGIILNLDKCQRTKVTRCCIRKCAFTNIRYREYSMSSWGILVSNYIHQQNLTLTYNDGRNYLKIYNLILHTDTSIFIKVLSINISYAELLEKFLPDNFNQDNSNFDLFAVLWIAVMLW